MREWRDIETREDCETLVRAFYTSAFADPIIGFIFTDVVKLDLEAHVPRITDFWETLLLGAKKYDSGAFHPHAAVHAKVELKAGHFERWLAIWYQTLDAHFAGPRAEAAKAHAYRLAGAFQSRLRGYPTPGSAPAGGIVVTTHRPA